MLETSRLRLREFVPQDVDALATVLGDPVAMKYYPAPFDRAEIDAWIRRNRARYFDPGFGLWAMTLKGAGDRLIGDCGCFVRELEAVLSLSWDGTSAAICGAKDTLPRRRTVALNMLFRVWALNE